MKALKNQKGLSIVEIVVAAAIIVTVVTAATGAWQVYLRLANSGDKKTQASLMTEEAAEALRYLRDKSWTSSLAPLLLDSDYYLSWNGTDYAISATPVFLRSPYKVSFRLSQILRDSNGNIVQTGGSFDPKSRKVLIKIYQDGITDPIMQSNLLIHDIFKN